jgi:hypothetical protein
MRPALSTALTSAGPSLPGVLAVPAGAPWPMVFVLGVLGLATATAMAVIRERHRHAENTRREQNRHAETLLTLGADPAGRDIAAIVATLRGAPTRPDGA